MTFVSSAAGTVTSSDSNGQKITATLVPGQNLVVTTGWVKPSSWVKVYSTAGGRMGVTALTYK